MDDILDLADGFPVRVAVTATSGTLAAKLAALSPAAPLPANTVRVALIPEDPGEPVRLKPTTAAATSPALPSGGVVLEVSKTRADALALYAANATNLLVAAFVWRREG